MVRMAEAFIGLGDSSSAVFVAERAVQLQGGSSPRAQLTLARAYAAAGRGDEARAAARRGLELLGVTGGSPVADSLALLSSGGER
jgi:Flp pilus assembly protein TadD